MTRQTLAIVVLGVAVAVLLVLRQCDGQRDRAQRAQADSAFSAARTGAATETTRIVIERADSEAALRAAAGDAIREIREQSNADDDAGAAGHAGLRALCELRDYSDRPDCGVWRADP